MLHQSNVIDQIPYSYRKTGLVVFPQMSGLSDINKQRLTNISVHCSKLDALLNGVTYHPSEVSSSQRKTSIETIKK